MGAYLAHTRLARVSLTRPPTFERPVCRAIAFGASELGHEFRAERIVPPPARRHDEAPISWTRGRRTAAASCRLWRCARLCPAPAQSCRVSCSTHRRQAIERNNDTLHGRAPCRFRCRTSEALRASAASPDGRSRSLAPASIAAIEIPGAARSAYCRPFRPRRSSISFKASLSVRIRCKPPASAVGWPLESDWRTVSAHHECGSLARPGEVHFKARHSEPNLV
jgi:hypothetical protein